jgi:hypothetical protein
MKKFSCHLLLLPAMLCALVLVFPAQSQDKPANNMEILRDKLKADKKLLVATNMELTESEAKNFWPVYDDYQKELQKINQRMVKLLNDYAADYRTNSVSDEKAKKLTDEYVSVQQAEANLTTSFVPKLNKALPAKKLRAICRSRTRSARSSNMIWRPRFLWFSSRWRLSLAVPIEWTHTSTAVGIL